MPDDNPFTDGGAAYARSRPTYPPELAGWLAQACARTDHALDVGCGTGQLSVLLAERFTRVTAVDPSASQLASAASHPGVTYLRAGAEALGLPDGSADLVVAAQAAHWFDLEPFYADAVRVARPDGVLALVTYGVPRIEGPASERFERFYWQDVHQFWPPPRSHVERGYRDLPFPFPERAMPPMQIVRDWRWPELEAYVGTWSAVRAAREAGGIEAVLAALAEVGRAWGPRDATHRIVWPIAGRVGALR